MLKCSQTILRVTDFKDLSKEKKIIIIAYNYIQSTRFLYDKTIGTLDDGVYSEVRIKFVMTEGRRDSCLQADFGYANQREITVSVCICN